jgi:hypothetical protein
MSSFLPLRFAVFEKLPIIEVKNKGLNGENCEFGGRLGEAGNSIVEYGKFNCTTLIDQTGQDYGTVDPNTGWYGGVNGLVEKNLSDLTIAPQIIPMETDRFFCGPVLGQYRITILSARAGYNFTEYTELDVGHCINIFTEDIWMLILAFLFLFTIILVIAKKACNVKTDSSSSWTVASFALFHDSLEADTAFLKVFAVTLAMFVFWTDQYFQGFMSTDLVYREPPKVIDTWEQMLAQPNVSVKFLRSTRASKYFKYAEKGSIRHKIWEYSLKGARATNSDNMVDTVDFAKISAGFSNKQTAICDVETILLTIRSICCLALNELMESKVSKEEIPFLTWFARESGIPYLLAWTYSKGIRSEVRDRLDQVMRRISESGLIYVWMKAMGEPLGPLPNNRFTRECMTDEIIMPESELTSLDIRNMLQVYRAFSGALALITLYHFFSSFCCDKKKRRERSAKRIWEKREVAPDPAALQVPEPLPETVVPAQTVSSSSTAVEQLTID